MFGCIKNSGARVLKTGRDTEGVLITRMIGMARSLVATFGGQTLGLYRAGEPAGFTGSVVGAIVVLAIWGAVTRNRV